MSSATVSTKELDGGVAGAAEEEVEVSEVKEVTDGLGRLGEVGCSAVTGGVDLAASRTGAVRALVVTFSCACNACKANYKVGPGR